MPRECAGAIWRVGPSWFAVTSAGVVLVESAGAQRLRLWSPGTGAMRDLAPEWTEFQGDLKASRLPDPDPVVAVVASSTTQVSTVLRVPLVPDAHGARSLTRRQVYDDLAAYVPVGERRGAAGARPPRRPLPPPAAGVRRPRGLRARRRTAGRLRGRWPRGALCLLPAAPSRAARHAVDSAAAAGPRARRTDEQHDGTARPRARLLHQSRLR